MRCEPSTPARAGLAALLVGAVALGCAMGAAADVRAGLGEGFELRVGESARVGGEDVEVGVEAVVADSRCAEGVTCVWEGDAVVRVWLRVGSQPREAFELHTARREPSAASRRGYRVRLLRLDPHPVAGRATRSEDYRARLEVTRGSSGPPEL